jgi:hypothetical protein
LVAHCDASASAAALADALRVFRAAAAVAGWRTPTSATAAPRRATSELLAHLSTLDAVAAERAAQAALLNARSVSNAAITVSVNGWVAALRDGAMPLSDFNTAVSRVGHRIRFCQSLRALAIAFAAVNHYAFKIRSHTFYHSLKHTSRPTSD